MAAPDSFYFYGNGTVDFCERDAAGNIASMTFVGNVPQLEVQFNTESIEHIESQTGKGLTDLRVQRRTTGQVSCVLEEFNRSNLSQAYYGTSSLVAGASVTGEQVKAVTNGRVPLANVGITTFTSLGSLVRNTDYSVDLDNGIITFLPGGAAVNGTNYAAAYTFESYDNLAALNATKKDIWLRFNGLNLADDDTPVVVDLFRVDFDPADMLSLIQTGNDVAQLTLNGTVLRDATKPRSGPGGQFMRWRRVRPA